MRNENKVLRINGPGWEKDGSAASLTEFVGKVGRLGRIPASSWRSWLSDPYLSGQMEDMPKLNKRIVRFSDSIFIGCY